MHNPPIRVAVAHENFLAQAGLNATFARPEGLRVDLVDAASADVIVTDFRTALQLLAGRGPVATTARVMIVAGGVREWQIREALRCGANAFLALETNALELFEAVRAVHAGGSYLSSLIVARLTESLATERLTGREEQVLALIVEGHCNKKIAASLRITVGTVKVHVGSLLAKLNVGSRVAAVAVAGRRGLVRGLDDGDSGHVRYVRSPIRSAELARL